MVTYKLEHTFCDACGKEINKTKGDCWSLKKEGDEWDTCSSECHLILEEETYGNLNEVAV